MSTRLTAIVTTKLGDVEIVATSPDHLSVSASNGGTPSRNLTVRGVPYHVHAHLYRWTDGAWNLGREDQNDYERGQYLHASRTDRYTGPRDLYASEPARKAITDAILTAVRDWVQTDDARQTISAGTRSNAEMTLSRIDNQLAKLRAEVAELEAERREAEKLSRYSEMVLAADVQANTTHAACPTHPGQWFHKSTGACSCGAGH